MKKVLEKIGGIALSGALVLNTLGSVSVQKVRAGGDNIQIKDISSMDGLSESVESFLNENALNVSDGKGGYTQEKQDAVEALYAGKTSIDSGGNNAVINATPKVYFGGNEYYIVNATKGEATLVAYKPYLDSVVFNGSSDIAGVKYEGSKAYNYLTKTGTGNDDKVYSEGNRNLYQDFFAGKRELEWNSVKNSTVYTRIPSAGTNDDIISSVDMAIKNKAAKLKDKKFYLMGGMYKGSRKASDAVTDGYLKNCEPYAYAGALEDQEKGYAVHCGLFDTGKFPWLRSACYDLGIWFVGCVGPFDGFVIWSDASNSSAVAPACKLSLSSIIFASESTGKASGKFLKKNSGGSSAVPKIELTLLDDGNSNTGLPINVTGNIAVSGNTATFTKSSGTDLASGQYLNLVCKTAAGYHLIGANSTAGSTTTFNLSSVEGDIESMSVIVCMNKRTSAGDPSNGDTSYNVRYARNVSTALSTNALSGNVSISNVLNKSNGYSLTANYIKSSSETDLIDGKDFSFQWCKSDGTPIDGATNATYYPKPEEYGEYLKVKVTGKRGCTGTKEQSAKVLLNFNDAQILNSLIYANESNKNNLASDIKMLFNGTVLTNSYVTVSAVNTGQNFQTLTVSADTSSTGSIWATGGSSKTVTCYYQGATSTAANDISKQVVNSSSSATYNGSAQNFVTKVGNLTKGQDYTVTYINNINAGNAVAIIEGMGSYTGRIIKTCTINPATIGDIQGTIADQPFTGNAICPKVTVGNPALVENRDYTVSYSNNVDLGSTANVTVTGIGNYKDNKSTTFKIVNSEDLIITGLNDLVYTGSPQSPTFNVHCNGKLLTKDSDYTVSGNTQTAVGEYTLTVTGQSNYSGKSATATFKILPKDISGESVTSSASETYDGSDKNFVTAVVSLTKDTDYTVTYQNNINAGTATAIIDGKGNYTGRIIKTCTINPATIEDIQGEIADQPFTGNAICPKVTVGNPALVENRDYTVSYSNNVDLGSTANVTVTGIGNYKDNKSTTFKIVNSEDLIITGLNDLVYTGSTQSPTFNVHCNGKRLTKDSDYTVSGDTQTDVGEYTLTVNGTGNYPGKKATAKFKVIGCTLTYHIGFRDDLKYLDNGEKNKKTKSLNSNILSKEDLPDLGLKPAAQNNRYVFLGWYYDQDYKSPAGEGAIIAENVNLYAKWGLKGNLSGTGKLSEDDKKCYDFMISSRAFLQGMSNYNYDEIKKVAIFKKQKTDKLGIVSGRSQVTKLLKGETLNDNLWN